MKYIIGLLWLISLLGAFYVGNSWQQKTASFSQLPTISALPQLPVIASPPQNKTKDVIVVAPTGPNISQKQMSTTELLEPNEVLLQVKTLLENGSGRNLSKIAKAYNLIQSLNLKQLLVALNQIDTNALDDETSQLFSLLLSRYAEFEPENAMAFVEQQKGNLKTLTTGRIAVLNTWADSDPMAALAWFKSSNNQNNLNQESIGLISIFSSLAKQSVDLALDSLTPFAANKRQLSMAISGLAKSLTSSADFIHVLDRTEAMDNKSLTQNVVRAWAKAAPEDAVLWLEGIEDTSQKNRLEDNIYRTWLYSDVDNAAESYMLSADSSNRQSRAQLVARTLSYVNPDKAISWLQQQSGIETDVLVKKVVKDSVRRNPEFAAQHLNYFTEPKEYIESSMAIYMSLSRNSQTKADEFLAGSLYKNEIEAKIAERKARMENSRRNRP